MHDEGREGSVATGHLFVVGRDYHLGDLLWLTAVLAQYRRQIKPSRLTVAAPDRAITRILEHSPVIDNLLYGEGPFVVPNARASRMAQQTETGGPEHETGEPLVLHDLRALPLSMTMVRRWHHRLPWLYYRDLWLEPRGQWLATFLGLGPLRDFRPVIGLTEEDRAFARTLPSRYVTLAPHVGHYTLPFVNALWHRIKGWDRRNWIELAGAIRREGYEPVTLAGPGQEAIPGTRPLIGLPIRQVAGVIEGAAGLVTVESGLWFLAAARGTPFIIVPWWLPRSVDWPGPMRVPHRTIYRDHASTADVLASLRDLATETGTPA